MHDSKEGTDSKSTLKQSERKSYNSWAAACLCRVSSPSTMPSEMIVDNAAHKPAGLDTPLESLLAALGYAKDCPLTAAPMHGMAVEIASNGKINRLCQA